MQKPQLDSVIYQQQNDDDINSHLGQEASSEYYLLRRRQRLKVAASFPSFLSKEKERNESQKEVDALTAGLASPKCISRECELTYFLFPEGVSQVAGKQPEQSVHTFVATTQKGVLYGCCQIRHVPSSSRLQAQFKLQLATAIIQEESQIEDLSMSAEKVLTDHSRVGALFQPECLCLQSPFPIHAFLFAFMKTQPEKEFPVLIAHLARLTTLMLQPGLSFIQLHTVQSDKSPRISLWRLLVPSDEVLKPRSVSLTIPLNPHVAPSKPLSPLERVQIVQHLLSERSVVLISADKQLLTATSMSLQTFLLPFQWEFVFIPLLAVELVDGLLHSPVPFLIGSLAPYISASKIAQNKPDVLIVDLDASAMRRFTVGTSSQPSIVEQCRLWATNHNVRNIATGKIFPSSLSGPLIPILPSMTLEKKSLEISTQEALPQRNDLDDFLIHCMRPVVVTRNELPEPADIHEQQDQGMMLTDDAGVADQSAIKTVYYALLQQLPPRITITSTASYSMLWCSSSVHKLSLPPFLSDNYVYTSSTNTLAPALKEALSENISNGNVLAYVQQLLQALSMHKPGTVESAQFEHNRGRNYASMNPALSYQLENGSLSGLCAVLHNGRLVLPDQRLRSSMQCWELVRKEVSTIPMQYSGCNAKILHKHIDTVLSALRLQGQALHSLLGPSVFESLGDMQEAQEGYLGAVQRETHATELLRKHLQWTSRRCFVLSLTLLCLGHHIGGTQGHLHSLVLRGDALMQRWGGVSQDAQWQEVALRGVAAAREDTVKYEVLLLQQDMLCSTLPLAHTQFQEDNTLGPTRVKQVHVTEGDFEICNYAVSVRECLMYLQVFCSNLDDMKAYLIARNQCLEQHIALLQEIVDRLKNKNDTPLPLARLLPRKVPCMDPKKQVPLIAPAALDGPDPFFLNECYMSSNVVHRQLQNVLTQGRAENQLKELFDGYSWQKRQFPSYSLQDTTSTGDSAGDSAWSFAPWSSCIVVTTQITAKAQATLVKLDSGKVDESGVPISMSAVDAQLDSHEDAMSAVMSEKDEFIQREISEIDENHDDDFEISLVPATDKSHLRLHQLQMNISSSLVVSKEVLHRAYRLQHGYQCLFEMLQVMDSEKALSRRTSNAEISVRYNNLLDPVIVLEDENTRRDTVVIEKSKISTSAPASQSMYTQLSYDENIDDNSFQHQTLDLPYELTLELPDSDHEEENSVLRNRLQFAQETMRKAGKLGFFHSPRMQYTPQEAVLVPSARSSAHNKRAKQKSSFFEKLLPKKKPLFVPHTTQHSLLARSTLETINTPSIEDRTSHEEGLGQWAQSVQDKESVAPGSASVSVVRPTILEESTIVCIESTLTEMNLSNWEPSTRECVYCCQDTAYVLVRRVKSGQQEQTRASTTHAQAVLRAEQGALQGSLRFQLKVLRGGRLASQWFSSAPLWCSQSQAGQGMRHLASVRRVCSNSEAQSVTLAILEIELRKQWGQTQQWTSCTMKKKKITGTQWNPVQLMLSPACMKIAKTSPRTKQVYAQLRRAMRALCELQQAALQFCRDCRRCAVTPPHESECICSVMHVVLKTGALPVYSHKLQRVLLIHTIQDVDYAEKQVSTIATPCDPRAFFYGCRHTLPLLQSAILVATRISQQYAQFEASLDQTTYYSCTRDVNLFMSVPPTSLNSVFRKDGPYDTPYTLSFCKENVPGQNLNASSSEVLSALQKRKMDLYRPEFAACDNLQYRRMQRDPQEQALYDVTIEKSPESNRESFSRKQQNSNGIALCFASEAQRLAVTAAVTAHTQSQRTSQLQGQNYDPVVSHIQFLQLDSILLSGVELLETVVGTDQTPREPQYQIYLPLKPSYTWAIKHEGVPKKLEVTGLASGSVNDRMQCERRLPMQEQLSSSAAMQSLHSVHSGQVCLDLLSVRANTQSMLEYSISECLQDVPWYFCE